jgi:hypothetical protein
VARPMPESEPVTIAVTGWKFIRRCLPGSTLYAMHLAKVPGTAQPS